MLVQLRELARFDQLTQPLLDAGPISASGRCSTRPVQVEQGGESLEPFGQFRVVHD
jgi:hypothetical protein